MFKSNRKRKLVSNQPLSINCFAFLPKFIGHLQVFNSWGDSCAFNCHLSNFQIQINFPFSPSLIGNMCAQLMEMFGRKNKTEWVVPKNGEIENNSPKAIPEVNEPTLFQFRPQSFPHFPVWIFHFSCPDNCWPGCAAFLPFVFTVPPVVYAMTRNCSSPSLPLFFFVLWKHHVNNWEACGGKWQSWELELWKLARARRASANSSATALGANRTGQNTGHSSTAFRAKFMLQNAPSPRRS